jgi:hypothetical protein
MIDRASGEVSVGRDLTGRLRNGKVWLSYYKIITYSLSYLLDILRELNKK